MRIVGTTISVTKHCDHKAWHHMVVLLSNVTINRIPLVVRRGSILIQGIPARFLLALSLSKVRYYFSLQLPSTCLFPPPPPISALLVILYRGTLQWQWQLWGWNRKMVLQPWCYPTLSATSSRTFWPVIPTQSTSHSHHPAICRLCHAQLTFVIFVPLLRRCTWPGPMPGSCWLLQAFFHRPNASFSTQHTLCS